VGWWGGNVVLFVDMIVSFVIFCAFGGESVRVVCEVNLKPSHVLLV